MAFMDKIKGAGDRLKESSGSIGEGIKLRRGSNEDTAFYNEDNLIKSKEYKKHKSGGLTVTAASRVITIGTAIISLVAFVAFVFAVYLVSSKAVDYQSAFNEGKAVISESQQTPSDSAVETGAVPEAPAV